MNSVYLNDINRIYSDIESLLYYSRHNDNKGMDKYTKYITDEVTQLVGLLKLREKD